MYHTFSLSVTGCVVNSLFQHEDDVVVRLVRSVQVDHAGVVAGRLQNRHLVDDLGPAVTTSPPLPEELGSKHFPRGLLYTSLHHRKLSPGKQKVDVC